MPKPTNITAIILCKNGAKTLPDCLGALTFVQNVIVGDDGSTDESIAIAKASHADVIKLPGNLDFSKKRNFLLSYVRTEWVLFIDVDEIVSKELAYELEYGDWKRRNFHGFFIPRNDFFMGRKLHYGETAHTKLLRLGRKSSGKWSRSVHETWKITGKVGSLTGELLHYSHPNLEEFFDKINRYTELEVQERSGKLLSTYVQLFVYPPAKFVQNYFFRFGFLDGYPGLVLAWMMSFHSLCVRIKMLEHLRAQNP